MDAFNDSFEQLPFDLEAEQSVLGALLLDPTCMPTVLEYVTVDCFYKQQHRELFSLMLSMFSAGETMDFITVLGKARGEHIFDSDEQAKLYMTQLVQVVPTTKNVDEYAKIIRERHYVRRLIEVSGDIRRRANEGLDAKDLLDHAEQRIYEIRQGKDSTGLVHISDVIVSTYDDLQRLSRESQGGLLGLSSGFSDLDRATNGLNKPDLIIIAARPGVGKTSLALNIAAHVGERSGKSVAIFSLEMSKVQLVMRMLSSTARIPNTQLRVGQLEDSQWTDLAEASGTLSSSAIYIDDTSSINIADMRAKLRRVDNLGLVIVDYLQLMTSAKKYDSRVNEVSAITRDLKILARDLNVPVVVLSQLSRASEKNPEPMLSDLRESGSIEQDADIVLMLYRENDSGDNNQQAQQSAASMSSSYIVNCKIAKNRHGETKTIQFHWDGQYTKFSTLGYLKDEQ
ncbi:MAG: replicative DNA helicase [Oscillospiraceae bacterium]|nr:replicative DNA helicase [Oscillospiraceae bacterium]